MTTASQQSFELKDGVQEVKVHGEKLRQQRYYVYNDGTREEKGPGKPKAGFKKNEEDGNYYELSAEEKAALESDKPEKAKKYQVFLDADGNELARRPKGPGKQPSDSHTDEDGNVFIHNCTVNEEGEIVVPKASSAVQSDPKFYVFLDGRREKKGRGRAKANFREGEDGNFYEMNEAELAAHKKAQKAAKEAARKAFDEAMNSEG
jgi:hypothetical protein